MFGRKNRNPPVEFRFLFQSRRLRKSWSETGGLGANAPSRSLWLAKGQPQRDPVLSPFTISKQTVSRPRSGRRASFPFYDRRKRRLFLSRFSPVPSPSENSKHTQHRLKIFHRLHCLEKIIYLKENHYEVLTSRGRSAQ